jgi:hypothetical protein
MRSQELSHPTAAATTRARQQQKEEEEMIGKRKINF